MIKLRETVDRLDNNGRRLAYTEYECEAVDIVALIRYDHAGSFAHRKHLVRSMFKGNTMGWVQTDGRDVIATWIHDYRERVPSRFMFRIYDAH